MRYNFAELGEVRKYCQQMTRNCPTCEACVRTQSLKGPLGTTIIPPQIMIHVAIDLFNMPSNKHEGNIYDMMAVCVDRHSGWIVAVPVQNKGLTGAKVAKAMLKYQWRPFGIPSIITSDHGSHFTGEWWRTMDANLGIRQAYSQAYHHQANGRAEMAGQQIMERLRKIQIQDKINWVEALPAVLDRIHDIPGETGLSPYQILFGRERPLANIPYQPPRECEDAQQFFDRMKEVDYKVAHRLREMHEKQIERLNQERIELTPFKRGDEVYYRRPEGSGNKLDSRWIGPALVVAREGEHSYTIEIKEGVVIKAHRTFLKKSFNNHTMGQGTPLFYHRRTVVDPQMLVDEWVVDKILKHRMTPEGKIEFYVKWLGYEEESAGWEPVENFFIKMNTDIIRYCKEKGV